MDELKHSDIILYIIFDKLYAMHDNYKRNALLILLSIIASVHIFIWPAKHAIQMIRKNKLFKIKN